MKSKFTYVSRDRYDKASAKYTTQLVDYITYRLASNRVAQCAGDPYTSGCAQPEYVAPPGDFNLRPTDPKQHVVAPAPITGEQAAYVASARLHLTPPKPVIGPSPDINEWHMAAVGYPMWLSASGNLTPAKVTDTVYDLTVSLTPHLIDITYKMGDGHTLTCTDNTHPWVMGTTPGAPSPTCGYTYTQPSLPHGSYTITATTHWAIDWAVNGEGGTIPLYENATTTLPVGELQVLIR